MAEGIRPYTMGGKSFISIAALIRSASTDLMARLIERFANPSVELGGAGVDVVAAAHTWDAERGPKVKLETAKDAEDVPEAVVPEAVVPEAVVPEAVVP